MVVMSTRQTEFDEFDFSQWLEAGDPAGTIVERYLKSCGLVLEGEDLRYHGALSFHGRSVAGMVALLRDVCTDEPCGFHKTFLDARGRRIGRQMLGKSEGACIKLIPDAEVTCGLGLAQSIEQALRIMQSGWRPVWACLSAGGLAAFPVLPGVDCLTVFADRDDSITAEQATRCCGRWISAGREAVALALHATDDLSDAHEVAA